jgi:hypothetical protein
MDGCKLIFMNTNFQNDQGVFVIFDACRGDSFPEKAADENENVDEEGK